MAYSELFQPMADREPFLLTGLDQLQSLNLRNAALCSEGLLSLVRANPTQLRHLNLSYNRFDRHSLFEFLRSPAAQQLTSFELENRPVREPANDWFHEHELDQEVAETLLALPHLSRLRLSSDASDEAKELCFNSSQLAWFSAGEEPMPSLPTDEQMRLGAQRD